MTHGIIDIFLEDLSPRKQKEFIDILGEDFEYDKEPVVSLDITAYKEGDEGYDDLYDLVAYMEEIVRRPRCGWRKR